jgi:hypothetical protein
MQHDFMHLSFPQDGLKEFVETLVVALRTNGKAESGREGGIRTHGGYAPTTVFEFYVVRVIPSVWCCPLSPSVVCKPAKVVTKNSVLKGMY